MKRQTRPFAVEIKNARNRAVTSFRPQSDRLSSRPGDLWERALHENLVTTKKASFSREVEAMFKSANNIANKSTTVPDEASLVVLTTVEPRPP